MKKKLVIALAALVAVTGALWAADNSWNYPVPTLGGLVAGDLIYAQTPNALGNINAVAVGQVLTSAGAGAKPSWSATLPTGLGSAEKTDGSVFLPAPEFCRSDVPSQQLIPTRVAASNWALARTATGGETYNIHCTLDSWLQRTTANKGVKITSINIAYQITLANLTSHTWGKVATTIYATAAAVLVGGDLATGISGQAVKLETASTTNPYLNTTNITTPLYIPAAANTGLSVEWQAVLQNVGIYRVFGVQVNFNRTDM